MRDLGLAQRRGLGHFGHRRSGAVRFGRPARSERRGLESPASLEDGFLDLPASEGVLNALSISDGTIVAGGFAGPVFTSTILTFDGTSWAVADVPDTPGQVAGVARIGDRWVAVGNGLPDNPVGFIWESADGLAWQPQQTIRDAALYDVIAGDGAIVAVGAVLDPEMNATAAAWSSADGATWERAAVAGSEGASMGSVAHDAGRVRRHWRPSPRRRPAALERHDSDLMGGARQRPQ